MGRCLGCYPVVASPLVQESSARVMSEHLVTLGMLVSTLCFARFARTGQIRDGLAFGIVAAVAILTHGNAWALGVVPGLTIALTNRWYLLRRLALWLAAAPVLIACVPWYAFAPSIVAGRWGSFASLMVEALPDYAWFIYLDVGLPVLIFALIGIWDTIVRVKPRTEVAPDWAALAAVAIGVYILHCILPVPIDSRYVVLLVPAVVLFSAAGVRVIVRRLADRLPIGVARVGLAVAVIAVFCVESFALPLRLVNGGSRALVHDVVARLRNVTQGW